MATPGSERTAAVSVYGTDNKYLARLASNMASTDRGEWIRIAATPTASRSNMDKLKLMDIYLRYPRLKDHLMKELDYRSIEERYNEVHRRPIVCTGPREEDHLMPPHLSGITLSEFRNKILLRFRSISNEYAPGSLTLRPPPAQTMPGMSHWPSRAADARHWVIMERARLAFVYHQGDWDDQIKNDFIRSLNDILPMPAGSAQSVDSHTLAHHWDKSHSIAHIYLLIVLYGKARFDTAEIRNKARDRYNWIPSLWTVPDTMIHPQHPDDDVIEIKHMGQVGTEDDKQQADGEQRALYTHSQDELAIGTGTDAGNTHQVEESHTDGRMPSDTPVEPAARLEKRMAQLERRVAKYERAEENKNRNSRIIKRALDKIDDLKNDLVSFCQEGLGSTMDETSPDDLGQNVSNNH